MSNRIQEGVFTGPRVVLDEGEAYTAMAGYRGTFVGVEGPRGTGKTVAILRRLVTRAMWVPGSRVLLVRSRRTRLTESVLVTLEEQVLPSLQIRVPGKVKREQRTTYELPGGSELVTLGLDDPERMKSVECAWAYISEASELETEDDAIAISGTLRQSLPEWMVSNERGQAMRVPQHQCILDTNPVSPGHWLNVKLETVDDGLRRVVTREDYARLQEFNRRPKVTEVGKWKRIITKIQDNPWYWNKAGWRFTKRGADYVGDVLGNLSGHMRARWVDGVWAAASGTVFPEFDAAKHVIEPFGVPSDWRIYVAIDPAFDHPCAVVFFTFGYNGCLYVVDEIYKRGMGVRDVAREIERTCLQRGFAPRRFFGDPQHCWRQTMENPRSIAMQFADLETPINLSRWPRSSDKQGMVEAMRKRLVDGMLKVFRPCRNTQMEFQTWAFKRTAGGNVPVGDDQYEDANNHILDSLVGVNQMSFPPAGAAESDLKVEYVQM